MSATVAAGPERRSRRFRVGSGVGRDRFTRRISGGSLAVSKGQAGNATEEAAWPGQDGAWELSEGVDRSRSYLDVR